MLIFERIGWAADDYARWSARLLAEQIAFVTPTRHRNQSVHPVRDRQPAHDD